MPLRIVRRPKSPYWVLRGTVRGIRYFEANRSAIVYAALEFIW
jgi:hypothetical protein